MTNPQPLRDAAELAKASPRRYPGESVEYRAGDVASHEQAEQVGVAV